VWQGAGGQAQQSKAPRAPVSPHGRGVCAAERRFTGRRKNPEQSEVNSVDPDAARSAGWHRWIAVEVFGPVSVFGQANQISKATNR